MEDSTSAIDMAVSYSEYSADVKAEPEPEMKPDVLSMLRHLQVPPAKVVDRKKKPEQRPVKQRKTGKISIENLAGRRFLSASYDHVQRLRLNEQQNRPQPAHGTPQAPVRRLAPAPTTTIMVQSSNNNQMTPAAVTIQDTPPASPASSVANSSRAESPVPSNQQPQQSHPPQQQQQQQQQAQQLPVSLQQIDTTTFCTICQTQYASRKGLTKHRKTLKHQDNTRQMELARQQRMQQAFAQARANRVNA